MKYRPDIDGLRAVAVLIVLFYHAGLGCPGGYVGVDVFFVISGYLITQLIWDEVMNGSFSYGEFWERRARRLLPALACVLLLTLSCGWFMLLPAELKDLGATCASQPFFMTNVYFWRAVQGGYFGDPPELRPTLHTWSLAVEEQFYLFFPLIISYLAILCRRNQKSAYMIAVASVFCVSLIASAVLTTGHPVFAFFLLPTRAWELQLGALVAQWRPKADGSRLLRETTCGMGLAMIFAAVFVFDHQTAFPGVAALLPCVGTALVLWSSQRSATTTGRWLASRPLVFFGQISYSLYLWHWPVFAYSRYIACRELSLAESWILVAVTTVLATASWRFIETPFRTRRVCKTRASIAKLAGITATFFLVVGLTLNLSLGFPGRCPLAVAEMSAGTDDKPQFAESDAGMVLRDRLDALGSRNSRPCFLLWGDSHAEALSPALDRLGRRFGVAGLAVKHSSTPPLLNYRGQEHQYSLMGQDRESWSRAVEETVRKKSIRCVFLVGNWRLYETGLGGSLLDTVMTLKVAGARVIFVKDVPQPGIAVPRALALYIWGRRGFPQIQVVRATPNLEEILRTVKDAVPSFKVLDPTSCLLDENGLCRLAQGNQVLYRDGEHLTVIGALQLLPLFEPAFEEIRAAHFTPGNYPCVY